MITTRCTIVIVTLVGVVGVGGVVTVETGRRAITIMFSRLRLVSIVCLTSRRGVLCLLGGKMYNKSQVFLLIYFDMRLKKNNKCVGVV